MAACCHWRRQCHVIIIKTNIDTVIIDCSVSINNIRIYNCRIGISLSVAAMIVTCFGENGADEIIVEIFAEAFVGYPWSKGVGVGLSVGASVGNSQISIETLEIS